MSIADSLAVSNVINTSFFATSLRSLQLFSTPTTHFTVDETRPDEMGHAKAFTTGLECSNYGKKNQDLVCEEFEGCFKNYSPNSAGQETYVEEDSESTSSGASSDICGPTGDGSGYLTFDLEKETERAAAEARVSTCFNFHKEYSLGKELEKSMVGTLPKGTSCQWDLESLKCSSEAIGDGWCDPENNNPCCNWDGGDCCPETCDDTGKMYQCGQAGFFCAARSTCKDSAGVKIEKCAW